MYFLWILDKHYETNLLTDHNWRYTKLLWCKLQ